MASASFVLYVWIPSHEWLLVSTGPVNPRVPGRFLAGVLQFPPGQLGPGTGQNLISGPNSLFPVQGYFHDIVQTHKVPPPPKALLFHLP